VSAELEAAALALAKVRNAAVEKAQGPVTVEPSAPADPGDSSLGEHGCVVLRELRTGGRLYPAGSIIPGDTVLSWKPGNRAALARQGRVAYFSRPITTTSAPTEESTDAAAV
jgi:hypothetical protein